MKVSTILDTDIGYDPDDLFALILLLKSKELKLDLIVTGDDKYGKRFVMEIRPNQNLDGIRPPLNTIPN